MLSQWGGPRGVPSTEGGGTCTHTEKQGFEIPAPPFASCVVMGTFVNFCIHFFSGKMETPHETILKEVPELNEHTVPCT